MKHKFGKILLSLLCLGGVLGMTGCQSADHTAKVPTQECSVKIEVNAQTGEKTGLVTLGIVNDTIYNMLETEITYQCYVGETPYESPIKATVSTPVRHGAAGYLVYTVEVEKSSLVTYVKITDTKVTKYQTLWQTYMVPFIIMFVVSGIALIFFAVEIFAKGLSKETVKEMFKARLASSLFTLGLILVICLIPLMFSSWVVTLILLGGFAGTLLLSGLMTLIRMAAAKR